MRARWVVLFSCLVAQARPGRACTTFCLEDGKRPLIGKSYDWDLEQGLVLANPKGLKKRALLLDPRDKPATWVARHASLTFNQFGREFPNGGMNDAGLVVEIMWLSETRAPASDGRPAVSELQWIQLQLDKHASVAEMVAAAQDVRVAVAAAPLHYMACDRSGACAVFENLAGKMVVVSGKAMSSKVLTNHTYADSRAALGQHRGFGGEKTIPADAGSLARFVRASSLVAGARQASVARALAILDSVRNGDYTKWQIVYDPTALRVTYRTLSRAEVKHVDLARLATACPAGAKMLDLAAPDRGDVTGRFQPYDPTRNLRLIESSLGSYAHLLPQGAAKVVAAYPQALTCDAVPPP